MCVPRRSCHWHGILRQLRLRPAQLEKLVGLHSEFLAMVQPALVERREALRCLRQVRRERRWGRGRGLGQSKCVFLISLDCTD